MWIIYMLVLNNSMEGCFRICQPDYDEEDWSLVTETSTNRGGVRKTKPTSDKMKTDTSKYSMQNNVGTVIVHKDQRI